MAEVCKISTTTGTIDILKYGLVGQWKNGQTIKHATINYTDLLNVLMRRALGSRKMAMAVFQRVGTMEKEASRKAMYVRRWEP